MNNHARQRASIAASCIGVLLGGLGLVSNAACRAPGDAWAEIVRQLPERGLKPKNVVFSSVTGLQGQAQLAGGSTPPSASGSGSVAEVTSTTVTFDTVPKEDPSMSAKFAIESVSPAADTATVLVVNGTPASMVSNAADAQSLTSAYGGRWHVFATGSPVVLGARAGQADRVFVAFERADTLPMPAAGSPLPARTTTRIAFQLAPGKWGVFPLDDPATSDPVLISPNLASPLRIKRGTAASVSGTWIKNASPGPLTVSVGVRITENQRVLGSSSLGTVVLGRYDLKPLGNALLPTQALPPGVYSIAFTATSGTTTEGSTEVILEVVP